jgi:tRNA-2-methylthio-N6-dimethylallyladenosine synthase
MKYYVRTYGCQMNVADSDEMGRHLNDRGLVRTEDPDEASIYLMNTCTVRHHAEERAFSEIGRLRQWKAEQADRKIVITGCAAERTKQVLEARFSHIDLVVGAKSIEAFGDIVDGFLERRPTDENLEYATGFTNDEVATFVTVMRGCNYSCTYCIVPYVRGRETYRPMDEILSQVRRAVGTGVREFTLLGQTVNSYHRDGSRGVDTDFSDLLEAVAEIDGVERIRFMSPHPYYMTDRVIDAMASIPAVCEGLHLPVQSGSTPVLKSMLRNYTREYYLELLGKLRSKMPDIAISTDLIVGFPGEGEDDFAQTLSLIDEARFDRGFVFKYSPRAGTPAASMDSHPEELVEARHLECLDRVEAIGREQRDSRVGSFQEVLIEEPNFGRTRGNQKMQVEGAHRVGETVRVQVARIERGTLQGVPVGRETPVSL